MSDAHQARQARLSTALSRRPSRAAVAFLWSRRSHVAALRLEVARVRAQAVCRQRLAEQRHEHAHDGTTTEQPPCGPSYAAGADNSHTTVDPRTTPHGETAPEHRPSSAPV